MSDSAPKDDALAALRHGTCQRVAVRLAAAADAEQVIAPAVALFDRTGCVSVDTPEAIGGVDAAVIDRTDHLALPPLVNAHAHLDLTSVGSFPFNGNFADWIDTVRLRRATDAEALAQSVRQGVRRAAAGGTGFIGDIAGAHGLVALEALRQAAPAAGMEGVSFVEVFGIGKGSARGLTQLQELRSRVAAEAGGVRLGVSPHAPYSCDDAVYGAAAALGLPLSTHLAEATEEAQFVRDASGPFADFLKSMGVWTPELHGWAKDPVERVHPLLRGRGAQLVHMNYLSDADMERLRAEAGSEGASTVVYCPRASEYFRHPRPGHAPHRYRQLLAAGVPVALGTDSAIVLGDAPTISVLDEMRLLWRRDGTDPMQLLAMATVHGARSLGVPEERVRMRWQARSGARSLVAFGLQEPVRSGAGPALRSLLEGPPLRRAVLWCAGGPTFDSSETLPETSGAEP